MVQATVSATAARLLSVRASRAVLDFLEQFVVLLDERVVRLELERRLAGGERLVEVAFVLVRDGEVVVRGGVGGINLRRALPAINRLAPQPAPPPASDVALRLEVHAVNSFAADVPQFRRQPPARAIDRQRPEILVTVAWRPVLRVPGLCALEPDLRTEGRVDRVRSEVAGVQRVPS